MSFSSIAIEQREKEFKALKTFLVYSTVGSLVLHIAVLASGIGNFLARAPELDEKPIELTFVEPEVEETLIKEEKKPSPEDNKLGGGKILTSSGGGGSAGGSAGGGSSTQSSPQIQAQTPVIVQALPQAPVPVPKPIEKPIVPQTFTAVQKQVETKQRDVTPLQPQKEDPVVSKEPQKPVNNIPKETTSVQKPLERTQPQESQSSTQVATNNTPLQSSTSTQESSQNLTNTLGNIRDLRATQPAFGNGSSNSTSSTGNSTIASGFGTGNGTGSGTGTGTGNGYGTGTGSGTGTGNGNGYGTGTGSGTGTGNGNGTGSGTGKIAAAPTKPKIPNGRSGDGRAACIRCENPKYPESARRRKVEGRVEVAVDTDKDGNVTNVRLTRSSGDRELDEETQRKAREWKLKPAEQGRQGVKIATEFSMKGSRRNREVQQKQQQQAERERQRQPAVSSNNNNSGDETPGRRRRNLEPSGESASSNQESRSRSLNQGLPQPREVSPPKNESETPTQVRNSEESSINNRLGGGVENNSGSAPIPPTPREVTGDVRTSGEQQAPTKRKKRELNQSNQSSDSASELRGVLRRSRESVPAAPSSGAEGE
ncbi:MAG: TonB family protein [Tolypothrix carrinoi HA7290-LM1]|jgi:TonB family protein|nr:TonB family protein [Tolypothrix carrinoi HA7290-LM1]